VGSLPGTDIAEAITVVLGEFPDLPHLPELPDRGPGAEIIGRGAGLLVDMPVELYAARWRLAARPGRDLRRTLDLMERDLDTLTERADGYSGVFKIQVTGPWTLAAGVELPLGGRVLRDLGACRDLTASLAEGVAAHVAEVAARLPQARILLQVDEPSLPAVLAGDIPTESGLGRLPAIEASVAGQALKEVIDAAGVPVVAHCCAPGAPIGLFREVGATAVSVDLELVRTADTATWDVLGEVLDAGMGLFAGAIPTTGQIRPEAARQAAERTTELWRQLGLPIERLAQQVVLTPACGLATVTPQQARAALTACREGARRLFPE